MRPRRRLGQNPDGKSGLGLDSLEALIATARRGDVVAMEEW
jgi:hypothetical protein